MNLLVFDIDGTLLDSTGLDDECYQQALLETYSISMEGFNWELFTDVTDQGVTQDILKSHLGRDVTAEEIRIVEKRMGELVAEQRKTNPEKLTPASGIENLLRELHDSNTAFCLATGAWKPSAEAKLSILNTPLEDQPWQHASYIRRRADIVLSSIKKAEKFYQVEGFNRICALGDGQWDLLTAEELKLEFIGVDLQSTGRLKELGAKKVIHHYTGLSDLLDLAFD